MEILTKSTYDQLNIDEKIKALLGVVLEPVSREEVLGFAGIDYDRLGEQQRVAVDAVFASPDVNQTNSQEPLFILNDDAREVLFQAIDSSSVNNRIVNNAFSKISF